jgi:REP element-mobilizing transposase RayT
MSQPLVIAYHLIWTTYGSWLPNDPRGSGSHSVACDALADLGALHYGRRKVQPAGWVIAEFYERALPILKFPVIPFSAQEISHVAEAIGRVMAQQRYTCYACAVMPDHAHLLLRKHKDNAEDMIEAIQATTRDVVVATGMRVPSHPVWTKGGWKVFLDHPDDVRRTIRYIEQNPAKAGLPAQAWGFVQPYDGWPLHPGHSPNSPYARRLRDAGRY